MCIFVKLAKFNAPQEVLLCRNTASRQMGFEGVKTISSGITIFGAPTILVFERTGIDEQCGRWICACRVSCSEFTDARILICSKQCEIRYKKLTRESQSLSQLFLP